MMNKQYQLNQEIINVMKVVLAELNNDYEPNIAENIRRILISVMRSYSITAQDIEKLKTLLCCVKNKPDDKIKEVNEGANWSDMNDKSQDSGYRFRQYELEKNAERISWYMNLYHHPHKKELMCQLLLLQTMKNLKKNHNVEKNRTL